MPVCEIDLRVGGEYRHVWRKNGVKDMGMGGVFREIVPPERLVATEKWMIPGTRAKRSIPRSSLKKATSPKS
jgi:uncharacterized protein YndB with AHSA1/START domain